jgi:hypothetical protein
MKSEIIEKINEYLHRNKVNEEDQVVYLMVELRKLLDRQGDSGVKSKYPLIRFYSDWIVHTDKKNITSAIRIILNTIESKLTPHPVNDDVEFLLLPEFKSELAMLFKQCNITDVLCEDSDRWRKFVIALTKVLADQPMLDPTKHIKEFRYITRDMNHLSVTIDFKDNRGSITIMIAADTL